MGSEDFESLRNWIGVGGIISLRVLLIVGVHPPGTRDRIVEQNFHCDWVCCISFLIGFHVHSITPAFVIGLQKA